MFRLYATSVTPRLAVAEAHRCRTPVGRAASARRRRPAQADADGAPAGSGPAQLLPYRLYARERARGRADHPTFSSTTGGPYVKRPAEAHALSRADLVGVPRNDAVKWTPCGFMSDARCGRTSRGKD